MKRDKKEINGNNMRDEYDFSKGIRGKHYKAYREGHTVAINYPSSAMSHIPLDHPLKYPLLTS
jgi:hypothetical protein